MRNTFSKSLLVVLLLAGSAGFGSTPDWLRSLAQQPQKSYANDVDAVVLLDEQELTVSDNGEMVMRGRIAFRILRPEGREVAHFGIDFDSDSKVERLHGWSITAKGQEYEAKDKDAFEKSLSTYEVFSDVRAKVLPVSGADVGSVVGYEYERKHRPYVYWDNWEFQGALPVERARYTLRLPSQWEYRADWINHEALQPTIQGNTYLWELSAVPRLEREYHRPPERAIAGQMVLTFFSDKLKNQTFHDWNQLGAWHAQLITGVRDSSPGMQQKVQELAPANRPMLERIRNLARFAQQDIRYAAIEIGIGGYRPHLASEVFAHRYGDCKDKANLLEAMLAQIGVASYHMPIHDERGVFTEKTPPNPGFNHVIIAIRLPDSVPDAAAMPALVRDAKLGRLVIFDPTNDKVPFGQLPEYEQDSYALLVTENGGEYLHLPASSPDFNRIVRNAKLKLLPDGSLQGEIEEVRSGYYAADARSLKDISLSDRKKAIEHFLGNMLANFQVDSFDLDNVNDIDKDLVLRYRFSAPHYAKVAGALLLLRPRVVGEMTSSLDPLKTRHYAYEFAAPFTRSDNIEIVLPDGIKPDELPDPVKATTAFGEYTSKTEVAGSVLHYTRNYRVSTTAVPPERIDQLKRLYSEILMDEKNMAVLKKAN
jgi:hypothetical protein